MNNVCVLGNGQLGRMLRQAGEPIGVNVYPIGAMEQPEGIPYRNAIITAEIERWPETPFTTELAAHPNFINRDVFPLLADRLTQKRLLDDLGLATSPWQPLTDKRQWPTIFAELGDALMIKRRTGGYDGRGQWRVTQRQPTALPDDVYGQSIVETMINFSGEVSLIGARNRSGECVFYPLTHNFHQDGILRASVALPSVPAALQAQAERMLSAIVHRLNYVGVMAMECFIVGDRLLINELAPRVHNSGHWTQNGASISQFELHLRAILDLPMPQPRVDGAAIMINLIGIPLNTQWFSQPLARLHWYHKEVRPGRKLGHINLVNADGSQLISALNKLKQLFPTDYQDGFNWSENLLVR